MDIEGRVRTTVCRESTISVWRIEQDGTRPGRLITRDERGSVAFESDDGGRSWRRATED